MDAASKQDMWTRPSPALEDWQAISEYALTVDGYTYAQEHDVGDIGDLANSRLGEYRKTGKWHGTFEELRLCLFFEQRRWRHFGEVPDADNLQAIQALYEAICEAWDREADVIAYRAKKDPRDLKILDPACGSGHFLLYSFDLMATIYEEAWEDGHGPASEVTGTRLQDAYSDLGALRHDVPGLILRYNLHGVDIDPRACQIAALALWLRAQRAFQELGLKPAERPPITKSHIVCAEPMPGERGMLQEYLREHVDPRLRDLVRAIWDKMRLAGEAGTLLKIEEEIEAELRAARERAMVDVPPVQVSLFQKSQPVLQQRMTFSTAEDRAFWAGAEEKLLAALGDYAAQVTNGHATQRRLFAEDAAQGFAFIDLCRMQFDVVLMNPPFGDTSEAMATKIATTVPIAKKNTYIASVVIGTQRLQPNGLLGAITDASFLHQTRYEDFRNFLLDAKTHGIWCMSANGWDVLDSYVETASYVLKPATDSASLFTDIRRDGEVRESNLLKVIGELRRGILAGASILLPLSAFRRFPKSTLAFWLPKQILEAFQHLPPLAPTFVDARCGMSSSDNPRFYKLWWEVRPQDISRERKWVFLSNGGAPAPLYRSQLYVTNYERDGLEVKTRVKDLFGSESRTVINQSYYFRPGFTYGKRTDSLTVQFLPEGHVFSNEGQAVFPTVPDKTWRILAYLNTSLVAFVLNSIAGQHKEAGYVGSLPSLPHEFLESTWVESATRENYRVLAEHARMVPESQSFVWPLLRADLTCAHIFASAVAALERDSREFSRRLIEIDRLLESSLGFGSDAQRPWKHREWDISAILFEQPAADLQPVIAHDLLSYFAGVGFGRWDVRFASGDRTLPNLPDPMQWLAPCPTGMLLNATLLPVDEIDVPATYPIRIAWDGIMVDDPEHREDIVRRVREVLAVLWPGENGARAETIEREACEVLGVRELRDYFRRPAGFFEDHLKRYSRSRRQAPIYWPLSTASGSYTLWIYYHRLTSDTLYTAVNRYVEPKIEEVRRRVDEERRALEGATGRDASRLRVNVERGQAFLRELQDFRDELLRVAALPYRPDLNDGVIISAAPLHRLFRLPRWKKDTKVCWENLERGEYDWAHLANTIWPDRVREKCRMDKSLAIAHGLEELYEEPLATAKKVRGRKAAAVPQDELLGEEGEEDDEE